MRNTLKKPLSIKSNRVQLELAIQLYLITKAVKKKEPRLPSNDVRRSAKKNISINLKERVAFDIESFKKKFRKIAALW